jgi:hypothetical protein
MTGPFPSLRAWLGRFATRPRFLALASFLFAGDLKADPRLAWLPVDLTLLTAACLCAVLAVRVARGVRVRCPRVLALVGLLYLSFLPGLWGAVPTAYGFQKVATLFTFTLLSSLAPLLLLEEAADLDRMVHALACFCLVITLGGLFGGGAGGAAAERLQAFGAGTISLGRATGFLFLVAALGLADGGPLPALTFGILTLAGITALYSGSRGPILAALLVLGLLFTLGRHRLGRRAWKLAGLAVALTALLAGSLAQAPAGSLRRVEAFFHGQAGASERYRLAALQGSWNLIQAAPQGLGWGRFATDMDPEKGLDRQYPHNLLAEVALEGGWLCGLALALVLALAVASAWSRTALPQGRLVFAGVVFYLVNGLVSGDVNDNRPLFLLVTAALCLPRVLPLPQVPR